MRRTGRPLDPSPAGRPKRGDEVGLHRLQWRRRSSFCRGRRHRPRIIALKALNSRGAPTVRCRVYLDNITRQPPALPLGVALRDWRDSNGSESNAEQRHFLPNDLAGVLRRLDDVEIDALLAAVTTEAERRGRRPPTPAKERPVADAKPQRRQKTAEDSAGSLTTSKLNAVRATFKAGVKPSAIARQFGISQSEVRKVLSQGSRREA